MRAQLFASPFAVHRSSRAVCFVQGCLVRWLPLGAAIAVTACGGGGSEGVGAAATPPSSAAAVAYATNPYRQQVPAQPLTLAVEADSTRAVAQRRAASCGQPVPTARASS